MEQAIVPPAYNPHLKRVLKSFQDAAMKSLSGPSNYVNAWGGDPAKISPSELEEYRKALIAGALKCQLPSIKTEKETFVAPAPLPVQQVPLFLPMDATRGEKSETILEGETIACFIVGGEKRLCLPQILNTVLQDFTLQQINIICDDLHIFCSRCSPEQLETLKMTGVLPWTAPSCGLITKTDAERLCNALLHRNPTKSTEPPAANSFKVYHECFGKCKGIFNPDLYTSPYAKCIECFDCHGMFAPQKFVCHSHKALENRTCHWGFDSANWRSYLLLAKDQSPREKLQEILEQLKCRFDYLSKFKRKQSSSSLDTDGKRAKLGDEKTSPSGSESNSSWPESSRENSAFRPWSPSVLNALKDGKLGISSLRTLPAYLKTGPPVLLNPERVIPFSEKNRYERNFAPNVSLAPASQQKDDADDDDEEIENVNVTEGSKVDDPIKIRVKAESPLEIDVSSDDTDASSLFNTDSVPSTPRDESHTRLVSPDAPFLEREREQELEMVRKALNGKVGNTVEAKEAFIQDFIKLRIRQEDRVQQLIQANKMLHQELELVRRSRKDRHRDFMETEHRLRQEIEQLVKENAQQARDMRKECDRLSAELEYGRSQKQPDVLKIKAKYEYRINELRGELQSSEDEKKKLQNELKTLKEKLKEKASHQNGHHVSPQSRRQHESDSFFNGQSLPSESESTSKLNGVSTEAKINQRYRGSEGT